MSGRSSCWPEHAPRLNHLIPIQDPLRLTTTIITVVYILTSFSSSSTTTTPTILPTIQPLQHLQPLLLFKTQHKTNLQTPRKRIPETIPAPRCRCSNNPCDIAFEPSGARLADAFVQGPESFLQDRGYGG